HHMLHVSSKVSGAVLWANLHLLFWLSLFPFATGWMGENHFAAMPCALYGAVLLMAALAYRVLQEAIVRVEGPQSLLKSALGQDWKGRASVVLYALGIAVAFWQPWVALSLYVACAFMWLVPDRRIERALRNHA
ncbi:MAG TPA: hypothetical protein VGE88_17625, partial [Lysobacter sp.]